MPSKETIKARLSRLMVATQQVQKTWYEGYRKDGWLGLTRRKQWCWPVPKASIYLCKTQHLKSGTSITPQSPLQRIDLTNKTDQNWPNHTNPTQVPLIMWGSMPLMIVSTTIMIVWLSSEVVHILHESWLSLLAGYPLYRQAPLHTSRVCARISLQACSIFFPSLQCTHWGFTQGVSSDHQGSLAPCGSQESPIACRNYPGGLVDRALQDCEQLLVLVYRSLRCIILGRL
jgi:hypothetical protein